MPFSLYSKMRLIRHSDLQTMCLNVILGHIDFYVKAKNLPQKAFRFLHRMYSDVLWEEIRNRELFCEEYMLWLLTPYCKNVKFPLMLSDHKKILYKFRTFGQVVISLSFTCCTIRPAVIKAFIFCTPNLTHLTLKATSFSSDLLPCLRKMCPSLVMLNVAGCSNVNDDGMLSLCQKFDRIYDSFSLKHLDVSCTDVTIQGISEVLRNFNSLEVLNHCSLSEIFLHLNTDVEIPRFVFKLTEFPGATNNLQFLKAWTLYCPYTEKVSIYDLTDSEVLKYISKFIHLKVLKIRFFDLNCNFISPINSLIALRGENLTKLQLSNLKIDIVAVVSNCKNLKYLYLRNVHFSEFEKDALKNNSTLKCLKSLTFTHSDFSISANYQVFKLLVSISNLEKLSIRYCKNVSKSVADIMIAFSSQLEVLDLGFTDIDMDSLLPFFNCQKLSKLYIDACINVPDEDLRLLNLSKTCEFGNTISWHVDFWSNCDVDDFPEFENDRLGIKHNFGIDI